MSFATVWEVGDEIMIRTPYDPEFVSAIKSAFHYADRRWDGDDKVWAVHRAQLPLLRKLLHRFYDQVEELGTLDPPMMAAAPCLYGDLLRHLPNDVLHKVYKTIVMEVHPDRRGGDLELCKQVNVAWDRLQGKR